MKREVVCSLSAERNENKAPFAEETTEQQVCKIQAEQKWYLDKKAKDRECIEKETVLSRNYGSDP